MMKSDSLQEKRYSEREIAQLLEREIVENEIRPGVRFPTGPQIAKRYNVSLKTADRAVKHLVVKGMITRKRGFGSVVQSNRAESQKIKIAFFRWLHYMELPALHVIYDKMQKFVVAEIEKHGFSLEQFAENTFDKEHCRIFDLPLFKYDVVIVPAGILSVAEELLHKTTAQVILFNSDTHVPGPWHQLIYDYEPGFRAALEHLLRRGYHKFFVPRQQESENSDIRAASLFRAASALRIPQENIISHYGQSKIPLSSILCGNDCAEFYLREKLLDHAIVSVSDFITYGMLDVFEKAGKSPGRDFALLSYDNIEGQLQTENLRFGITGITHPLPQMAAALADMLENITRQSGKSRYYQTYYIPADQLIVRSST